MSYYTHFNIKFCLKDDSKMEINDYETIKKFLFFNQEYEEFSEKIQTSWTGIFIFELCEKSNSIILETTPVGARYLRDILEGLSREGKYSIRAICSHELEPDYIEIHDSRLKEKYLGQCLYFYDEVNVFFKKPQSWGDYIKKYFVQLNDTTLQYKKLGRYYSHCEITNYGKEAPKSSLQNKCSLTDRNNFILNNCDKVTPVSNALIENNWYTDPIIWEFMASFETGAWKELVEGIEFKYNGELVRLYNNSVYHKCYILDGWSNLDNNLMKI